jgi:adenylate cyclase
MSALEEAPGALAVAERDMVSWLTHEAPRLGQLDEQTVAIAERLADILPLERLTLHLRTLHPEVRGTTRLWRPGTPLEVARWLHAGNLEVDYYGSPVERVQTTGQWLDLALSPGQATGMGVVDRLANEGYTHYLMGPMPFSDGMTNAASFATRRPGGFAQAEVDLLHRLLPLVALVVEVRAARRTALNLLNTYVGPAPTERILAGEVRRGDMRHINAAILLSDMRNFTLLSDTRGEAEVIATLNDYFDCVVPAVRREGGEVLKYMGDGVLAIFEEGAGGRKAASIAAWRAARAILLAAGRRQVHAAPEAFPIALGVALHWGGLAYGNIGSGDRLDFTVIGRDVNLASRVASLCKPLDQPLLMSDAFAHELGAPLESLGQHAVRGLGEPVSLFAPMAEAWD